MSLYIDEKEKLNDEFKIKFKDYDNKNKYVREPSFDLFLKQIGKYQNLTLEEELELMIKAKKGHQESRDKLINSNIRFVVYVAKKYVGRGVCFDDLVQIGCLGLMEAFDKFKIEKKCRFITLAYYYIKLNIVHAIEKQSQVIRTSVSVQERINDYKKVKEKLSFKLKREATNEEIAKELNLPIKKIEEISFLSKQPLSLNALLSKKSETELLVLMPNHEVSLEKRIEDNERLEKVREIFTRCHLTDREKDIIKLYFGFDDTPCSLEKIADKYNLTRQRISQIIEEALNKIRSSRYLNNLISYSDQAESSLLENETIKNNKYLFVNSKITPTFTYFKEFNREDILFVLEILPLEYQQNIIKRYGKNLDNPSLNLRFTEEEVELFEMHILPEMKERLEELLKIREFLQKLEIIDKISNSKSERREKLNEIRKERALKVEYFKLADCFKIFSLIDENRDLTKKEIYAIYYIIYFINTKSSSRLTIAKYLNVEKSQVTKMIKEVLIIYKKYLSNSVYDNNKENGKILKR